MNDMIAYEGWRDVALQEALVLLKEESSSPAGPAYQAKWAEYFAKKSAEAARMVMDALKDAATVAPELCRFAQTVSGQEAAFFGQCGHMTLAHMSGQAQLYTPNFYREADRLEEKWKITQILEGSWETGKLDTRKELAEFLAHGPRIDALRKKYPGEFADRTKEDWTQAAESLRGKKFEKVDLSYREMGAQRLELAKKAATVAWEAIKKEASDRMIPAFPAPDIEARAAVAGKWVELPWITPSGIVNDLGQAWAVAPGSSGGGYVARMTASPEFERFFRALYRFGTLVQPGTAERYQFIGELLPTPAMITYRDRPLTAHQVRLVAGRAGEAGEFVVDLRKDAPAFAGESEMAPIGAEGLKDNASPARVLEFMVGAIKRADEKNWRRCFATWRASVYETGRPHFFPLYVPSSGEWNTAWEAARRLISKDVYDARVDRIGKVRRLFDADRETGAPTVDQVTAYFDFIGHFDGEYRSFNHFTLTRRRILQRINEGPWRLVEIQGL